MSTPSKVKARRRAQNVRAKAPGKQRRLRQEGGARPLPPVPRCVLHPLSPAFAEVLRRVRLRRKLSLYRLEKLTAFSRDWLGRVERGGCAFSLDVAARICDALGCAFEWVALEAARLRLRRVRQERPL